MTFGKTGAIVCLIYIIYVMVIEMTSYSNHVTPTKNENKQKIETKYKCFCEESFIDRSF